MDIPEEIGQVLAAYYAQSATITLTPTDFAEWLRELPPLEQAAFAKAGFQACRSGKEFQRYCLEWRGLSLHAYVALHLSCEAYSYWLAHVQQVQRDFTK